MVHGLKTFAGGGPVLFGDGGSAGQFGQLRGGGVKGPVVELTRRSAAKMPVVMCSEFRTSKLCLDCGREAEFHNHGVTYCKKMQLHHRMENRDKAAGNKIGARYLAGSCYGQNLGPWSRAVKKEDIGEATVSTVLRDALDRFRRDLHGAAQ